MLANKLFAAAAAAAVAAAVAAAAAAAAAVISIFFFVSIGYGGQHGCSNDTDNTRRPGMSLSH